MAPGRCAWLSQLRTPRSSWLRARQVAAVHEGAHPHSQLQARLGARAAELRQPMQAAVAPALRCACDVRLEVTESGSFDDRRLVYDARAVAVLRDLLSL